MANEFISVIALFEDESAKIIETYRNSIYSIADNGNYIPHLTLAVYDKPINLDELKAWVDSFCSTHNRISFNLNSIGVINEGSICLLPDISRDLYQYYMDIHQKFEDSCRVFFTPNSNTWIPHIGLFYTTIEDAKTKFPKLMDVFKVTTVTLKSLRITKRSELGYETIHEIEISNL